MNDTPDEEWRTIQDHSQYEVSSLGRVRSFKEGVRILKASLSGRGYPQVYLDGKAYRIHRLVLCAFVGDCPIGYEACHNNGDKTNNNLLNLRWDTHPNNLADVSKHETSLYGSAKIKFADAKEIRELHKSGKYSQRTLALLYGISPTNIKRILTHKIWREI